MTGTLSPDATGTYNLTGTHDGKPYWLDSTSTYYLNWSTLASRWLISTALGDPATDYWDNVNGPLGDYTQQGTYTGSPNVNIV